MQGWISFEALMTALAFPMLAVFCLGAMSFPPPPRPFYFLSSTLEILAGMILVVVGWFWIVDQESFQHTFWFAWSGLVLFAIGYWLGRSHSEGRDDDDRGDWGKGDDPDPDPLPLGGGGLDWQELDRQREEWEENSAAPVGKI